MKEAQTGQKTNPGMEAGAFNIALVGGGANCKALIKFLEAHTLRHLQVRIAGVADVCANAPGMLYARERGIYTTPDYRDFFALEDLHLLIEITNRDEILDEIMKTKPRHLKVVDHLAARLFWELIELQEEKVKCERRLAHSDRLGTIGRMASHLAHEIRNPLVSIGGFATAILNAPELPGSLKPKAQIIVSEVNRLERVLKSMREYTRPLQPNKTRSNFNKLVETAYTIVHQEFKSCDLEIALSLDNEMPDSLFDVDLMLEAVVALVRKLKVFMKRGQGLSLRTEVCWDTIGIYLEDRVGWIPPDLLENMFNPFTREPEGSNGLDMAMSKKIIDDHGGEIKVMSEEGVGTTIIIELPI